MTDSAHILGVRFDARSTDEAADEILGWASRAEARYACFSNAHGTIEAQDDPSFMDVLNGADLNVPDGMSVVRAMRSLGVDQKDRVYGPDVTLAVAERAAARGVPVAFYGSSQKVLDALSANLPQKAPGLQIVSAISPPFRALTPEEDEAFVQELKASGARIVFVGLGCPRQERWAAEHADRIGAVCLAVGAAFDFHAGLLTQAPGWIQQAGLEWAFRLAMEPKRLWRRYSRIVPRFMGGFAAQRFRQRQQNAVSAPTA
ncbi:WecB/TagA/CpsF family glycosyltransferase [Rubricoccus marinus]|uniref:Glycosyltransferase n=1 Tax=Rubricoccus marinus TaxID=716817 RepID=A0A259U087_9BACT|nr:WecB/TagA/CpsF family glycosyltransferase [Rubricoccus marinus]OZC03346.1 glycosyltransferase [Rubricoccus marinus]